MIGGHAFKRLIYAQRGSWQGDVGIALAAPVYLMPLRKFDADGEPLPFVPEHEIANAINSGSLRLPYQILIIETPTEDGKDTVVDLVQRPDPATTDVNGFSVLAWVWKHNRMARTEIHDVHFELNGDHIEIVDHPSARAMGIERCEALATTIIDCILLITHSANRVERATQIDRERMRKLGLGPTGWEYRVVDLPLPARDRVDLGGTHASPRWHRRRGHWRRVKTKPEPVWIPECEVGDHARGGVVKDYKVGEPPK